MLIYILYIPYIHIGIFPMYFFHHVVLIFCEHIIIIYNDNKVSGHISKRFY